MSKLETNQVDPATGTTLTLGTSGDTITIPSGVTIANSGTATGFGETNTPAFSVYKSANFELGDASETKYAFDTESYDTDNAFDNSTNYRFTVPSGKAGKYFFYMRARYNKGSVAEYHVTIKKNGSDAAKRYIYSGSTSTNIFNQIDYLSWDVSCTLDLSVGDYVEGYVYMNAFSGTTATMSGGVVHNEFLGYRITT
jgi:hypothetical protein